MKWFKLHMAPYMRTTHHLSLAQEGAYMRLLMRLLADGRPLPADMATVYRLTGARRPAERRAIDQALASFFQLECDGWHHVKLAEPVASFGHLRSKRDPYVTKSVSIWAPNDDELVNEINVPDSDDGSKPAGEGEGEEEGEKEPLKGASPPSTTIGAILFNQSRWLAASSSVPEKSARSLIGRWRKTHGDVTVLTRIEEAQRVGVSNPVEWLTAALRPAPPKPTQRDFN